MAEEKRIESESGDFLSEVVGHEALKARLKRLCVQDRLPHALLFYGPEGSGKEVAGLELGRYLLCEDDNPPCGKCGSCVNFRRFQHPDFHFVFPAPAPKKKVIDCDWETALDENQSKAIRSELTAKSKDIYYRISVSKAQNILIAQVRQLIRKSSLTSLHSANRFALISPADRMNREAQNSLLKLLEEPSPGVFICLVTSRVEALLPTIKSRCQPFYFPPLTETELSQGLRRRYNTEEAIAKSVTARSGGSITKAVELLQGEDTERKLALNFLTEILKNNPIGIHSFSFDLRRKDKEFVKGIIRCIEMWLGDISRMDAGLPPRVNVDKMDRLNNFRDNIIYEGLEEARLLLLDAIDLVDKNVYLDMIFANLANQLGKMMIWKKKAG